MQGMGAAPRGDRRRGLYVFHAPCPTIRAPRSSKAPPTLADATGIAPSLGGRARPVGPRCGIESLPEDWVTRRGAVRQRLLGNGRFFLFFFFLFFFFFFFFPSFLNFVNPTLQLTRRYSGLAIPEVCGAHAISCHGCPLLADPVTTGFKKRTGAGRGCLHQRAIGKRSPSETVISAARHRQPHGAKTAKRLCPADPGRRMGNAVCQVSSFFPLVGCFPPSILLGFLL